MFGRNRISNDKEKNRRVSSYKNNRASLKHVTKKALIKMLRVVYKTGLMIEKCVSYANHKGFAKVMAYISAVFALIGKLITKFVLFIGKKFSKVSHYILPVTGALILIAVISLSTTYAVALKVSVGDEVICYASNEKEIDSVFAQVESDMSEAINGDYSFEKIPVYSFSLVKKSDISSEEEIYSKLTKAANEDIGQTYALYVDGTLVGTSKIEGDILNVLDTVKAPYESDDQKEKIDFVNNIEIIKGKYPKSFLLSRQELLNLFTVPAGEDEYTVVKKDTASKIAKKTGLSITKLQVLNPDYDLNNVTVGDKIKISNPKINLEIKVIKTLTYSEAIPFSTITTTSDELFEGTTKTKVAGVNGSYSVTAEVEYINGVETDRNVINKTLVSNPINRQLVVGTKNVSPSGSFVWPIPGSYTITSKYGYRWGSFHPAIDISASYGQNIIASDGGVVTFAGWNNTGYGYMVLISHGNGVVTRYAHCSSLNVKVGQKVHQGQLIAKAGSTGWSTGVHLHFAIEVNGNSVNPLNYVG